MKKFSLLLTLAIMMVGSTVFAGSIDYLSNQSAKFCMNTAANARTDGADIVAYNPAGTALMGEGIFIDISSQTLLKYYEQSASYTAIAATTDYAEETYEQDEPTLTLPNAYVVYNMGQIGIGKLAAFLNVGIPAGGGKLKWDGIAAIIPTAEALDAAGAPALTKIQDTTIEGSSVYYGAGIGAAYSFLEDMISLSAGVRYVSAKKSKSLKTNLIYIAGAAELAIDTEWDYEATGYTPIFGFDVKPMKELTIGVRYEMETDLEFEYEQDAPTITTIGLGAFSTAVSGALNKDGFKDNQNLPQILSLGVEYAVLPELTVGLSTNIFFIGDAKYELTSRDTSGVVSTLDYAELFGTGYEVALGATYRVIEPLKVSASVMYTDQGAKDALYESSAAFIEVSGNPVLNSVFTGIGATYTVIPNLDLSLALSWVHYLPEDSDVTAKTSTGVTIGTTSVEYKKDVYNIALGVGYKI